MDQRTVGVDLSTDEKKTALCVIDWSKAKPVVSVRSGVSFERILDDRAGSTLAIDCPFGWPNLFVDFLVNRRDGKPTDGTDRRPLRLRETDIWVHGQTKKSPLSVSTDKLGSTAIHCSDLLDGISPTLDRAGGEGVIEVYPAASLSVWKQDAREGFFDLLAAARIALDKSDEVDDHSRDAVVCALTARAFDLKLIQEPIDGIPAAAKQEGWIFLPSEGSLEHLVATS